MSRYLERYQQGEHVQVWQELVALRVQIGEEPLHSDALSVARETMRRARHNVELLAQRLQKIGFQFEGYSSAFEPTTPEQLKELERFQQEVGHVPLSLCAWIEQVGTVNFMGTYPRLSSYHGSNLLTDQFAIGTGKNQVEFSSLKDLLQDVDGLDNMQNLLQQFFGNPSQHNKQDAIKGISPEDVVESDPLVVDIHDVSMGAYEEWPYMYDVEEGTPYWASIAPDIFHKSGISGSESYQIKLPDPVADAILHNTEWGQMTFVEYLRLSFEWAGFPGLQDYAHRDEILLKSLKDGLLPL